MEFGSKVLVRVSDKTRKSLEAKAHPGMLLRSISDGRYCVMIEVDKMIHVSRYYIVEKDTFPKKEETNAIRVKKQEIDECAGNWSAE